MKKLNPKQINSLNQLLKQNPLIIQIVKSIAQNNAKAYLVGGAVRDLLLDIAVKDLDIEVHGLAPKELEKILSRFGPVSLVGKSYGVFRLHGLDADWSVPRSDASGRKPEVKIDPYMSLKDAFRRRDLTINAMGMDLTNFGLVDPFGGYNDLKNKILRATDAKLFLEDPLRFFRVMQFIGRFQMRPDDELNKICSEMRIKDVSIERIDQEFAKLFLKSNKPSLGIRWLKFINRLKEILPELYATIGVEQNPQWHPEGDVFEHTMQSLDAAVNLNYDNNENKLIISWAAVCHDLGKVKVTKFKDGKIISYGHELYSADLAKKMLKRVTRNENLINIVSRLCRYHMMPGQFIKQNVKDASYKKLALKLAPITNLNMLAKLFYADRAGRNGQGHEPLQGPIDVVEEFKQKIKALGLEYGPEKQILLGKDIADIVSPGQRMGEILKKAYSIQIEQNIKNKEELKKKIIKKLK